MKALLRASLVAILAATGTLSAAASPVSDRFVAAALALYDPTVVYDPAYRRIAYPGGDVPKGTGVCADVVVRAYRGIGIDLQQRLHDDMRAHFSAYPKTWGMRRTDSNIDHRRVPNLAVFFARHGTRLAISVQGADYRPGDIVVWNLRQTGSLPHIGIVTDRRSADGLRPLMMHNIGGGQVLEDMLFAYRITGHFRYALD